MPKCRFISVSTNSGQTLDLYIYICPIFKEGHAEFLYDFDACTHFYNHFFIITVQTFMMVSGTMVDRWLRSAVQDMKENNRTEVLCPCRKCKGIVWLDPHDDGRVEAHLLMTGFMDGYTRWIIEDEDDDVEDADGAGMMTQGKMKRLIMAARKRPDMAAEKGPDMAAERTTWTPRSRVRRY